MDLTVLVEEAMVNSQGFQSKMIIDDVAEGALSAGRAIKDKKTGHHIDIETKCYHGFLLLRGSGRYIDEQRDVEIRPGDFVQRFPHLKHSTVVTCDDWYEIYVVMGKTLYETLRDMNVLTERSPVIRPGVDVDLIHKFIKIYKQLERYHDHELGLVLPSMVDYLTDVHYRSKMQSITTEEQKMLQLAVVYMKEHLNQRPTMQEVATYVNVGYEKFRKIFTKHYGISPGNYMIQQRIYLAESLLSEGTMSITEIALHLGYIDSFTFSKQFKKVTGRTPSGFKSLFLG